MIRNIWGYKMVDLRIFDKELNPLGVVDEMASLIWTIRYFNTGEAKLLAPVTSNNKELLVVGNIIVKHDGYVDYNDGTNNWYRAAEITYVHYKRDVTGKEQIEATGSMITGWFNQRVITPQLALTDTCQNIVNKLVNMNVGSSAASARQFPQFTLLAQEDLKGSSFDYSNDDLKALGDEIRDVCQQGKLGYGLLICGETKQYGFYLYAGADLTADNEDGNAPCIFSREYDNVSDQEFEDNTLNIKNFAYVRGAADDDGTQEVITVDEESATGLSLKEVMIDATDIQRTATDSSGTQIDIDATTYTAMLRSRGKTELAGMIENYTFTSEINTNSNLKYKEDFDLGDRVTCVEPQWGVTINSRITEIVQTFEAGRTLLQATFGESAPSLLQKIRKVR